MPISPIVLRPILLDFKTNNIDSQTQNDKIETMHGMQMIQYG